MERVLDCLQRATDGMTRDDETRIDWVYVEGQIKSACHFLNCAWDFASHASCDQLHAERLAEQGQAAIQSALDFSRTAEQHLKGGAS